MKKKHIFLTAIISFAALAFYFFSSGTLLLANEGDGEVAAANEVAEVEEVIPEEIKPSPDWLPNLEAKLVELFGEDIDNIGFVYYDPENGDKLTFNQDKQMIAASTFKVGLNMIYYDMVRQGKVTLEEGIRYDSSYFEGGTGILQGQTSTISNKAIPIQDLLDLAITHSDNIATRMLSRKLGGYATVREKTNAMVGLNCETKSNKTTAEIQYRLLRKIYEDKDDPYYAHLIQVMKETVFHDRLDKYLPYEIVAHKIGNYSIATNDIGIVETEHPYIIVMFTEGVPNAAEKIAQASKLVYEEQLIKY